MIDTAKQAPSHRQTTLVVALVLAAATGWNLHRGRFRLAEVLALLAGILAVIGLFVPFWSLRFHRAWMALASALGYIQSRVLISITYYGLLTPLGAIMRMTGHDSLGRRSAQKSSYWVPRESPRQDKDGFERSY